MNERAGPGARPGVEEITRWVGARLDEIGGASVGRIEGAYVDAQSGEPVWLLVRVGRFGRRCLVPARDAVAGAGHVWVPYPRDLLRGAPRVEPGEPLDIERERELSSHYGFPRAAELADRPPGAVTSRSAA
ncbi:MAG: PRC-barrel domain-containing protein [Solirubrobacterales bacterium]